MKKCLNSDCGNEFEESRDSIVTHWEVDTNREKMVQACPSCGSTDIEEMKLCPACEEHWITSDRDFCDTCIIDTNWCIDMVQRLTGADWQQTISLVDYVIEKGSL